MFFHNGEGMSWVIKEKATGKVILETFDSSVVKALNTEKYEAVPILKYLESLNGTSDIGDMGS